MGWDSWKPFLCFDSIITTSHFHKKINKDQLDQLTTKGFKFKDTDNLYLQDKPDMMETSLKFIPYYCWSNRGENEMLVWVNEN